MGLDNIIRVKIKPKEDINFKFTVDIDIVKYADSITFNEDHSISFDIFYWRKWWNFRNYFINYLESKYKDISFNEGGKCILDKEDVIELYDYFDELDEECWDEEYWEWEDCADIVKRDKRALKDLRRIMRYIDKIPYATVTVEFIDSF